MKRCLETRVGVVTGGGARCVVAPPISVLSIVFLARPAASFRPLVQQVQGFTARWIYQNAPETQLHPLRVGLFLKIFNYFSSAGVLSEIRPA